MPQPSVCTPATPLTRRAFLKGSLAASMLLAGVPWFAQHMHAETVATPAALPADVPLVTLHRWRQGAIAAWQQTAAAWNDDPATRQVLISDEVAALTPFTSVVPSWTAQTPPGTWVEVQLRVRVGGRWTKYYRMMRWDAATSQSKRTSFWAQGDSDGRVNIDTLVLTNAADAAQARVLLGAPWGSDLPTVETVNLCLSARPSGSGCPIAPTSTGNGTGRLAPPLFSQYDYAGGDGWCSPTALAMVLGYWYYQTGSSALAPFVQYDSIPSYTAPMVYDPYYQGNGNWAFNTAYAASRGVDSFVTQLESIARLAAWVRAGVPVITSLAWGPGDLDNASGPSSEGHLMVVIGVRDDGYVEVADPSGTAQNGGIVRAFKPDQFMRCWQCASAGTAYMIYPYGWAVPALGREDTGQVPPPAATSTPPPRATLPPAATPTATPTTSPEPYPYGTPPPVATPVPIAPEDRQYVYIPAVLRP